MADKKERAQCANCSKRYDVDDLEEYSDFWSRVEVGGEIPAGDCPECGAFAYLIRPPARRARVVVTVRGGVVQDVQHPRGVLVVVKDFDDCGVCGGVKCDGGHRAEEVHGRPAGRA